MVASKKTTKTQESKSASKTGSTPKRNNAKAKKKMNDKKDSPANSNPPSMADALQGDASLDTVRDILFGKQVREHDKRSQILEKTLKDSITRLEKEFSQQINQIEKNIEKLKDQLDKQAAKTADSVKNQFTQASARVDELEKSIRLSQNELHEELNADRIELEKNALAWNEDLAKQLEIIHQELQHSKTDRSTLSQLLHSMADSISNDSTTKPARK